VRIGYPKNFSVISSQLRYCFKKNEVPNGFYTKCIADFMKFGWDESKNQQKQQRKREPTMNILRNRLREIQNIPDEAINLIKHSHHLRELAEIEAYWP
jgi:hypothetical protein